MKILFLDVDGVLNMDADFVLPLSPPNNGYKVLNKNLVRSMEKFVADNDITIVWSSTWRLYPEQMEYIQNQTLLRNYEHEDWCTIQIKGGISGPLKYGYRGYEVDDWLERHKGEYTHWAIIDDYAQFLPEQQLNFVQTDESKGVTEEDFGKLKEILNC